MSDFPPPQSGPPGYSNYPRENYGFSDPGYNNPNQRPPGVYFDSIGIAWRLIQPNLGTWVLTTLVAGVLYYAIELPISLLNFLFTSPMSRTSDPGTAFMSSFMVSIPLGFVAGAIIQVIIAGFMYMGVKQARNERIGVGDLFSGFKCFGAVLGAGLLVGLMVDVGFLLLIIPGLFLIGLFAFVPILIIDRNMGVIQAIQECYDHLRSHAFAIFGLMFVAGLVSMLGFCLCGIGFLFTGPIYAVVLGLTYNNFYPPSYTQPSYQPIGMEPPR